MNSKAGYRFQYHSEVWCLTCSYKTKVEVFNSRALSPRIFLVWPFQKKQKRHVQGRWVARELQKKKEVQLVRRRTFLIRAQTAEDPGYDRAFDLAPLDNIPPTQRPARCLPKDERVLSHMVLYLLAEFLLIWERNVPVSQGALQISVWHFLMFVLAFSPWRNSAETTESGSMKL